MATAEAPDRLAAVRRTLTWAVIALVVVLAATGAYLAVAYRPSAAQAWPSLPPTGSQVPALVATARTVHRWCAWLVVLPALTLAAVALAEAMVRWHGPRPRRSGALAGPAVGAFVVVALISGLLLPWDQLALRAVTVGTDLRGYTWLLGDDVRFVLRDGAEWSVGTMRALFGVHVLLVGAVLAAGLASLARRR
jgi:quinol-cytochrome oxidoreductase complex cytochrome b subunit